MRNFTCQSCRFSIYEPRPVFQCVNTSNFKRSQQWLSVFSCTQVQHGDHLRHDQLCMFRSTKPARIVPQQLFHERVLTPLQLVQRYVVRTGMSEPGVARQACTPHAPMEHCSATVKLHPDSITDKHKTQLTQQCSPKTPCIGPNMPCLYQVQQHMDLQS